MFGLLDHFLRGLANHLAMHNSHRIRLTPHITQHTHAWMQAVPYDLSLGAVRAYMWKRSDDPVLQYGRQNPSRPAPMAVLGPAH